ncbi:MAG: phosphate ABC transporter permease PstA [Alphaproteobacteria bacterium]|nr:phosphate ABC transporter permease PstA [Alphaproteobacteria bacterium]
MTNAAVRTLPSLDLVSDRAQARVRARYRAETRFKFYGLFAIGLTGLFILVVLTDIVRKGLPAFTQHQFVLSVRLDPAEIDPNNTKDPAAIRQGDFQALVRNALRSIFPDVKDRIGRRQLDNLLSSGAADRLRADVVADPGLIGQTVKVPVLISERADLYYKNFSTRVLRQAGAGTATPSGTSGEIEIALSSDNFAAVRRTRAELTLTENDPSRLIAINGGLVKLTQIGDTKTAGTVLLPLQSDATAAPGAWQVVTFQTPAANRRVNDREVAWFERLRELGHVESKFNWAFFTSGDSREPELAGIRGALVGSAITLFVTLIICLPLGVAAAIYLEEFAPKNRLTEIIEVNINNLAAVPSIVFGLLGLAVFLNFMGLPRSAPLVGGLVLALLVLPTIIIASRAALKAVPPSIKEAALGVGASHQQAIFHHVLPLAMPGIMTGTIIGMAHALGETAPLLLIGMVAFIVEVPTGISDAATVLPVQIYLWSDLPEISFQAKTAAAIMVLLLFLFVMNGAAIAVRKMFERRW